MRRLSWVFIFTLILARGAMALSLSDLFADGDQCKKDPSGSPGLPKTVCFFPSCPDPSEDCLSPEIDRASAQLDFLAPTQRWFPTCPNKAINGPCWEATLDFKFKLDAKDTSGVQEIGLSLSIEQGLQKKSLNKFMMKADTRDTKGRYEAGGGMILYIGPGQRLDLVAVELCAKDGKDNEGCVPPLNQFINRP